MSAARKRARPINSPSSRTDHDRSVARPRRAVLLIELVGNEDLVAVVYSGVSYAFNLKKC